MLSYVFDMFHILLSGDSLRDLWNVCVCVCVYSLSMIKNLILTSTDSNEMCGPWIIANLNSSEQCVAYCDTVCVATYDVGHINYEPWRSLFLN